ncbi:MAG: LVIVD repeat-containing protein [Vicinamibacteraceae bacterium]
MLAFIVAAGAVVAPARVSGAPQPVVADLFSSTRAVHVNGDIAYAVSTAGLLIYDVSDRSNPQQLSQLPLDRSGSFGLAISGNYAYVLAGEIVYEKSLLRIIDISDPRAPRIVGEFSDLMESRVQAMQVAGTTVALGEGNAVTLLDVSDPANPTRLARVPIISDPEQIVSLAVHDSTLFAAWVGLGGDALTGGVTSVDISDPSAPTPIGVFGLEGTPSSMTSVGETLYVGETLTAVVALDASDPANIVEVHRIDFPLTGQVDVYAEDDRLFTAADGQEYRIGVFDISDPSSPQRLEEMQLSCRVVGMDYDSVRSAAFMPCQGADGSGISDYHLTQGGGFELVSNVFTPEVRDAKIAGFWTTLLAGSSGLLAVRPVEGGRVEITGRLRLEGGAYRIQVVGTRAYVLTADDTSSTNARVQIVDVSKPSNMRVLGSLALSDLGAVYTSKRFFVVGKTLYVAEPEGLVIYDASNPAALRRLGSYATPTVAENVIVSGNRAYVNTLRWQDNFLHVDLYVIDVRRPRLPRLVDSALDIDAANFVSDMAVRHGRLFMLDAGQGNPMGVAGDGRILVVDVRTGTPRLEFEGPTTPGRNGYAREIQLVGRLAFIADGLDGVSVLSVADTAAPRFLGSIDTPGFANSIWVGIFGNVSVADLSSFQRYGRRAR